VTCESHPTCTKPYPQCSRVSKRATHATNPTCFLSMWLVVRLYIFAWWNTKLEFQPVSSVCLLLQHHPSESWKWCWKRSHTNEVVSSFYWSLHRALSPSRKVTQLVPSNTLHDHKPDIMILPAKCDSWESPNWYKAITLMLTNVETNHTTNSNCTTQIHELGQTQNLLKNNELKKR